MHDSVREVKVIHVNFVALPFSGHSLEEMGKTAAPASICPTT